MHHPFDGYHPTDLDTDPREMALADYWIHRDETEAERAATELAAELLCTEEFIEWSIARREEALEHQIAAYDAAHADTPCADLETIVCDACGHDCYPIELVEGACASCRQLAGLADALYAPTVAA